MLPSRACSRTYGKVLGAVACARDSVLRDYGDGFFLPRRLIVSSCVQEIFIGVEWSLHSGTSGVFDIDGCDASCFSYSFYIYGDFFLEMERDSR